MKKPFLFSILSIAIDYICMAQYPVPEETITGSCLVQIGGSFGSGFFAEDSSEIFFITARHVIINQLQDHRTKKNEYKFKSQVAEIQWYARQVEKSDANIMRINLEGIYKSGSLKFGEGDAGDYLIMRIGVVVSKGNYSEIQYSEFVERQGPSSRLDGYPLKGIKKLDNIKVGDDILMIGYPKSLGLKPIPQYDFNRPLVRKGSIAGKNSSLENIIIDCPSFGGNSGGAIFVVTIENILTVNYYLVGIVSAFIPYEEVWVNENYGIKNTEISNSGYSVVIPVEKAINRIAEIRKSAFR